MTPAEERIARVTEIAGVILGVFVITLFLVASVMLLAGCSRPTCSGHGGVSYWSGSWAYCNDGTVEPG